MSLLENISCHQDLIKLNSKQRKLLCDEIRQFLILNVSQTGGHLASNLGVVELTVALETVFDTNKDRLVFDVGHQSYVHKLLTGRQANFSSLRQFGGMAGFPKPCESDTDAFVAGHASSSVSIALGMARARTLQQQAYHVVALMGDGAATGGMAYEGLNDAAYSDEPLIVVLNDNEMSIDRNVGGVSRHLARLRTKKRYLLLKRKYRQMLERFPGGMWIYRVTRNLKDRLKRLLLRTTVFENMGLRYLGPVDGHDVEELIDLFCIAKEMKEPVLIHVQTHKGHGYRFAEEKPSKFHGVGRFDPDSGQVLSKSSTTFSDVFGATLMDLAADEPRVCAITAAMPGGTGLLQFKKAYPNRLFDVGIAEEHAVSMAGGLAKQGMIPVIALYSTFLQRSYDQILQDVCMLHLHVVFAVDRAGLVGEDGETHHGVFDVGFLRQAPGMTVLCPSSGKELSQMLTWAVTECSGPVAVRYPRGTDGLYADSAWVICKDSGITKHRSGDRCTVITYGTILENVMSAAAMLSEQGIEVTVLRLLRLTDLDLESLSKEIACADPVVVIEEVMSASGIYQELKWQLRTYLPNAKFSCLNLGNAFVTHGKIDCLYQQCGLDPRSIAAHIMEVINNE